MTNSTPVPAGAVSAADQGRRVQQLREALGWSRVDLASRVSTTPGTVRLWETGEWKIAPHEIAPLAYALGVDPGELAEPQPEEPPTAFASAVHFCGGQPPAAGKVERYRFVCPWCLGWGTWESGESCRMCAGLGVTDDEDPGVDLHTDYPAGTEPPEAAPEPIPRPPGVMRQPCVDCAFRPGSPETDYQRLLPGPNDAFFCHHGLVRRGDGYLAGSTIAGRPLGALVCASWWALHIDGQQAPSGEFRDPGGSNREADR